MPDEIEQYEEMIFRDAVSMSASDLPVDSRVVPFSRDENGYLRGVAVIGRVGIQRYRTKDGQEIRILRRPEEVSDAESLASMSLLPMSRRHPAKNFTPESIRGKQVGSSGENIEYENGRIFAPLNITEKRAQDGVFSGKERELSIGYKARLVREPGTWEGEPYDAEQKRIRGNHIALTEKARAGSEAAVELADGAEEDILFDSCDLCLMDDVDTTIVFSDNQPNEKEPTMAKFTLKSGQVVEADQEFIDEHSALIKSHSKLEGELSDEKSAHTQAKADIAAKDQEIQDAKEASLTDADVTARAKEMIAVKEQAIKAGVDFKDGEDMSIEDMKKKTIEKAMPDAEFNDSEIDAFYSAAKGVLKNKKEVASNNRKKMKRSSKSEKEFKDGEDHKEKGPSSVSDIMDSYHASLRDGYLTNNKAED